MLGAARANATLLELDPARPLRRHVPIDKIEVDAQLARDLGPSSERACALSELAGDDSGIVAEDSPRLPSDVEAARVSARARLAQGAGQGSRRAIFEVRGGPARRAEPPGTLLLWFFDTSAGEEERAGLALRLRQTEGALNSLTHLIEAAPFPMWYRGPGPQARPGQQRLRRGGRRHAMRPTSLRAAPS